MYIYIFLVAFGSWIPHTHLESVMLVFRDFKVESHKQDFLFSFNEKQHQVITFRHLDALTSDAAVPKQYCEVSRRRKTKEKETLCLVQM